MNSRSSEPHEISFLRLISSSESSGAELFTQLRFSPGVRVQSALVRTFRHLSSFENARSAPSHGTLNSGLRISPEVTSFPPLPAQRHGSGC
jgi:hypothetical protein